MSYIRHEFLDLNANIIIPMAIV